MRNTLVSKTDMLPALMVLKFQEETDKPDCFGELNEKQEDHLALAAQAASEDLEGRKENLG